MIRIENLSVQLTPYAPLRGLSLHAQGGQIVGLLGLYNQGRSTLLKVLSTLVPVTAATVNICGLDPATQAPQLRPLIGYQPEVTGAYESMTVEAVLRFYARLYQMEPQAFPPRMKQVLKQTGLEGTEAQFVDGLDPEAKVRLNLAKTLLHDPKVLLLDNPCLGLPTPARLRVRSLIAGLRSPQRVIVSGSNLLSDLVGLCDRIAIIHHGQIVCEGPADEITAQVAPGSIIELDLGHEQPGALQTVQAHPAVSQAEAHGHHLIFALARPVEDPSQLIEELAARDVAITAYREHEVDLNQLIEFAPEAPSPVPFQD